MKIKDLSVEERPRERLIKYGPKTLSSAELLAIILRVGNKSENIVQLSHRLLREYSIKSLSRLKISTLKKLSGIGEAKACQIVACFELGRRLASFNGGRKVQINSAKDVVKLLKPELSTLKQEHFVVLYLDTRKRVLRQETVFVGTLNSSVVHPREVFATALQEGAAAIVVLHNHPSGDPTPSEEDVEVTHQLAAAGELMGVELLDHVVIGAKKYVSLQEEGLF